ncbi:bifunctional 2-polyprenyl-6-hydroxyphenol methylase/3-demethylubiquinol 3-O-methyltransferase UbiG [Belnapia sp. F-4-1]|uniref:class I SAM-dependent methyltransferase n=1 Tax=Belnapia sp. F-4-1 TaxID=1545443 RepID=UPI0005BA29F5|nr:class I SAM-dependent methyltransferase [Belnapia sp. F-4-1]
MNRAVRSLPPAYFEALYARDADPWRFADSTYERAKYDATLAALLRPRYGRVFEVGCSIGVLTRDLAARCDALLAVDAAETALSAAQARCTELPQVTFQRMQVPQDWPEQAAPFDLILLSEVVYYLDEADVVRLAARVGASLAPGGEVLLVHWTGETDYPLSGDAAVGHFIRAAAPFAQAAGQERTECYRLDLLRVGLEDGSG